MWSLNSNQRRAVVMLPGGVLPAEFAYKDLIQQLGPQTDVVAKELEMYSTPRPRTDYGLSLEVAGILRAADEAHFERVHLLGSSPPGPSSLAFAAARPALRLTVA